MAYKNLQEFMKALEADSDLIRIRERVSMDREITELHRRSLLEGGPALLCDNVYHADGRRAEMPVLVNIFGSIERVARAVTLGGKERRTAQDLREVGHLLAALRQPEAPQGIQAAAKMLPLAKIALKMRPKIRRKAPSQEIILKSKEIDLDQIPIQTCWPDEPAPLVTWPLIVTKGPSGKGEDDYNLGIYRMQKLSKNKLIMRWLNHRGGAQHFRNWKKVKKEPMPAAAVIGADPGTILAAATPAPETLSEYQLAGLLRGANLELVACKSVALEVPAHAEIILEGTIDLEETAPEGPYGDHTGYYNSMESFPVFTLSAITMRSDPIYLSTYTGRPPDEPSIIGEALNEIFVPLLQQQFPEIVDFYLPPEGCSYRIATVSIRKSYAGHARRIMMGIWSYLRQFTYTKWIVVVDDDINIREWNDIWWAISTRADPARDLMIVENTPIDYLDFASPVSGLGSKIGIDATNKIQAECTREWGKLLKMDAKTIGKVDEIWSKLQGK